MRNSSSDVTRSLKNDWRKAWPGLLVSAVCLAIVLYLSDLPRMVEALRLADYRFVALGAALSVVWLGLRAQAWRTLLQEIASFRDVFLTVNEGYLLSNLLPFRLGEVGLVYLFSRKAKVGFWQVFPTIIIERAFDLTMTVGLLLSTLPWVVKVQWAREAAWVAGGLVLFAWSALYYLARHHQQAMAYYEKMKARHPLILRLGQHRAAAFFAGLTTLTDAGRFFRALGWMGLNWGLGVVQYYTLLRAFALQLHPLWAAFALAVASLGIAAPSSPGAVGVLELSLVGALAVFGIEPSIALAFAATLHLLGYLLTGLIGSYALARDGESLGQLYRQIRNL